MSQTIPFDSVADLYDSYVCVDFNIPFWLNELGQREGRVLELTSGIGRVSLPLLRVGVNLTCVDYYRRQYVRNFYRLLLPDRHRAPCFSDFLCLNQFSFYFIKQQQSIRRPKRCGLS